MILRWIYAPFVFILCNSKAGKQQTENEDAWFFILCSDALRHAYRRGRTSTYLVFPRFPFNFVHRLCVSTVSVNRYLLRMPREERTGLSRSQQQNTLRARNTIQSKSINACAKPLGVHKIGPAFLIYFCCKFAIFATITMSLRLMSHIV